MVHLCQRNVSRCYCSTDLETISDGQKIFYLDRPLQSQIPTRIADHHSRTTKWISKLFGYDYEITYKPDKENAAADAFSRNIIESSLDALFIHQNQIWDDIRKETETHPYMQKLNKLAEEQKGGSYTARNKLIYYKHRVVLPLQSHLISQLLQSYHDSPLGGHSGLLCTYKRLTQQFHWLFIKKVV